MVFYSDYLLTQTFAQYYKIFFYFNMVDPSKTAREIDRAIKTGNGQIASDLSKEALSDFFRELELHRKGGQAKPFDPSMKLVWIKAILNLLPRMKIPARVPESLKDSFTYLMGNPAYTAFLSLALKKHDSESEIPLTLEEANEVLDTQIQVPMKVITSLKSRGLLVNDRMRPNNLIPTEKAILLFEIGAMEAILSPWRETKSSIQEMLKKIEGYDPKRDTL